MKRKKKKIVFNEDIDKAITYYSLGFTFLGVSVFLLLNPSYFFAQLASYIVGVVCGVSGAAIIGIKLLRNAKVNGIIELLAGSVIVGGSVFAYYQFGERNVLWLNILLLLPLLLGTYGFCHGLFQGVYSIIQNLYAKRKSDKDKATGNVVVQTILFLTQLFGLTIAVLNLIKVIAV